jgi:TP901 family phage tail tape measure protein
VLDAAAASGLEMAEVANHVSNVLKGMGLETSEATRVADVLALASARTNSSIGSLGESMKNVASTARQFKIPLEEVVAGVALLQDVGLDASVAGSAMNTMLTKMAAPTAGLKKQMKQLGISFEDSKGNMLPMSEVLKQLAAGTDKAGGNMKQVAFLAELVGLRGQKAASNLKTLFESGKINTLVKELEDAEGAASKMSALRMRNLKGDWTLFGSAVDAVKVRLFETQSGPLRDMVKGMTKWVGENEKLIESKFVQFIKDIKDNLPKIVMWAKRIGIGLAVFYTFAAAVKIAQVAVLAFEIAMKVAALTAKLFTLIMKGVALAARAGAAITWLATAAQKAWTLATWLGVAAQKIYTLVVASGSRALGIFTATQRGAAAANIAGAASARVAAMSMGMLAKTAGAAALAVGGVMLAMDQAKKLAAETGGLGISGTVSEMWNRGTLNPFEAVDAFQNEKAIKDRDERERLARKQTKDPTGGMAAGQLDVMKEFGFDDESKSGIAGLEEQLKEFNRHQFEGSADTGFGATGVPGEEQGRHVTPPKLELSTESLERVVEVTRAELLIKNATDSEVDLKQPRRSRGANISVIQSGNP